MPTPNVDPAEVLYRQIGTGGDPIYYDPARNPPVHQSRFLPTRQDADGLSLIRSQFRSEIWSAFRQEKTDSRFRLAVTEKDELTLIALDLGFQSFSVNPSPDSLDNDNGEPWAHCVVAEVNRSDYDNDGNAKRKIKEWAMAVADSLAANDVVGPFPKPTDTDPYRPAQYTPVRPLVSFCRIVSDVFFRLIR